MLDKDKLAEPYYLEEVQGDMEIAMACCRYLSIVFRPDFPPVEANAALSKLEMMVEHLSGMSLLIYVLVNFQAHLNHLGSNDEKIRDEFMNFVKLLINRSNSYASLLLGQWIEALKWPTKLHVDDTLARLCLHFVLVCASEAGNKEVVEVLLCLRSDLLHIEAGQGHLDTMKRLLENGPPITRLVVGEWVPFAAANRREGGLKQLLDLGADVNSKDTVGRTPLSYAARNGYEGNLELLLQKGANVNSKDTTSRTPLSYAAENGHEGSLGLLLQKEANVNLENTASRSPLSYAAENGHEGSLKLLLQKGADVNSKDMTNRTPLSYAAENGHDGSLELLLHNGGSFVKLEDTTGRTPLSHAAGNGHEGSVRLLLQNRLVDLHVKDRTGRTPLSYATTNGHEAVAKLLQSHITT